VGTPTRALWLVNALTRLTFASGGTSQT
jgi:hypothetical protein